LRAPLQISTQHDICSSNAGMPIEFEFTATPELGSKALRYLLWRRGGRVGPIAMILLPVVIAVMAADPAMRAVAYVAAGAAIMLFVLFLLAVADRRRIRRRFFESNADRTVRVAIDEASITVKSAAGSSALPVECNQSRLGRERRRAGFVSWLALCRVSQAGCPSECS
jgi:hypothetical protein